MASSATDVPVLEVRNVSMSFGKVRALQDVSMRVYPGDVVGLLGDNGAGKSTLINLISGNFRPDEGDILLDGKPRRFSSPAEAQAAGIHTVYQNAAVAENASVSANFFIGRELSRGIPGLRILQNRAMEETTRKVMAEIGVQIPSVRAKMGYLSGGQRQSVIVGRFVHWGGRIALLDEPFAALGLTESQNALDLISQVSARGIPIVLITHNIGQAWDVINKVVVLRHGEVVGDSPRKDVTPSEVVSMITGASRVETPGT